MEVKTLDLSTGVISERDYTNDEIAQIQIMRSSFVENKSIRINRILSDVGCINETHLQKDIFVIEAFGQLQGVTPQQLYQANPGYTSLIDARNAIEAIKAE